MLRNLLGIVEIVGLELELASEAAIEEPEHKIEDLEDAVQAKGWKICELE